jgi:lysophospholipase L1-like esterase
MGPETNTQPPPGPTKSRRGLITALIVILCLLLLEMAARYVFSNHFPLQANRTIKIATGQDQRPLAMIASALWHHQPNPDFYPRQLSRFNTRGPDFTAVKPPGEVRVFCIGDSTTFGWKNAPSQTYPAFLQQILRRRLKTGRIKVINAGVPGFNSAFALSYLALRLINLKPDLVVIKVGYNDVFAFLHPEPLIDYTHVFPRPFSSQVRDKKFWRVARYVYLLRFFGHFLLDPPVQQYVFGAWGGRDWRRPRYPPGLEANVKATYESYLRSMIALCRARKIPVILLDLPLSDNFTHYWPWPKNFFGPGLRPLIKVLNQAVARVARDTRTPLIVTRRVLQDGHVWGRFWFGSDFWDCNHNTPAGNHKIARLVAKKILAHPKWLGLTPPGPPAR